FRAELDDDILSRADTAAIDTADPDLAHIGAVIQRNHLHLQGTIGIVFALRYVLEYGVEQRAHIAFAHVFGQTRVTRQARGVYDGKVQLLFGGAQLVEQVERGVDDEIGARAGAIDLVDDHN